MKATLCLLIALTCFSQADSLLPEQVKDAFAPQQIVVGDLVTVVIRDEVRTLQQVNVTNKSNTGISNPISKVLGAVVGIVPEHEDENKRDDIANTRSQYSETITATVVAVNRDNLTLSASSTISLDGKTRGIQLSGKVRRRDIGADNRVESQHLADAVIEVDGLHKSPVESGLVTRALRFLF